MPPVVSAGKVGNEIIVPGVVAAAVPWVAVCAYKNCNLGFKPYYKYLEKNKLPLYWPPVTELNPDKVVVRLQSLVAPESVEMWCQELGILDAFVDWVDLADHGPLLR